MGVKAGGFEHKYTDFEVTMLNEHIYLYALRSFQLFFAFLFGVSIWLQAAVN